MLVQTDHDRSEVAKGIGTSGRTSLRRLLPILQALLAVVLFIVAVHALRTSLSAYHWSDFAGYLGSLPKTQVALAVVLTFAGYLAMTSYDAFALHHIERRLRYGRVALASFTGYAINNSIGLSGVVGMSLRYRFYSGWGLAAGEIAKVFVFCTVTYWLGFAALGGVVFLSRPPIVPPGTALPFHSIRLIGAALLIPATLYFLSIVIRRKPIRVGRFQIAVPKLSLFVAQVVISMADWVAAAAVLYLLLPSPQSFIQILGVFLLAQIAGLVSNVPSGLGVFDAIVLLFLTPFLNPASILGALIAFRGIYFLLPLGVALVLLAAHEWKVRATQAVS